MGGFYFSYFFLNKRLNLGASTCHLEMDMDFLPLKIKTSTACSLASNTLLFQMITNVHYSLLSCSILRDLSVL